MTTLGGEQTSETSEVLTTGLKEGVTVQICPNIASLHTLDSAHLVRSDGESVIIIIINECSTSTQSKVRPSEPSWKSVTVKGGAPIS